MTWLVQSETQARALQSLQELAHVKPQVQIMSGGELLSVEMREEIELRIGRLLKKPSALQTWKADFSQQHECFLLTLHHVMTQWGLYEETKYECAFELELHTEKVTTHLR